jgi:hypothetical protein
LAYKLASRVAAKKSFSMAHLLCGRISYPLQ